MNLIIEILMKIQKELDKEFNEAKEMCCCPEINEAMEQSEIRQEAAYKAWETRRKNIKEKEGQEKTKKAEYRRRALKAWETKRKSS